MARKSGTARGLRPSPDVTVSIWSDRAQPSLDRLSAIQDGVIGAILVFLSLVLQFDLRIATWVTVGIPPPSSAGSSSCRGPDPQHGDDFGFFLMVGIVGMTRWWS